MRVSGSVVGVVLLEPVNGSVGHGGQRSANGGDREHRAGGGESGTQIRPTRPRYRQLLGKTLSHQPAQTTVTRGSVTASSSLSRIMGRRHATNRRQQGGKPVIVGTVHPPCGQASE
jgi:hypothetical protein